MAERSAGYYRRVERDSEKVRGIKKGGIIPESMKFPFSIHMTDLQWHEYLMTIPEHEKADQWAKDLLKAFDKGWIDAIDSLRMLQNMLNEQGDKRAIEWIQQHKRIEKNQDMARARAYKERFGK